MKVLQFSLILALLFIAPTNLLVAAELPSLSTASAPSVTTKSSKMDVRKLFEPEAGCVRTYIYKNKTYPADSSRKADGEGLRNLLKSNPDAEIFLNKYQSNIKRLRWPAYFGGIGVASMIGGLVYSEQLQTQLGRRDTRLAMIGGGGLLILASYAYGQFARSSNEKTLEKAINLYNGSVREEEKIQVNLTPLSHEAGGKVQTIVPF